MAAADAVAICIAVELERDEDFAAPAFDPAGAESRAGGQADGAAMLACRQRGEEVPDQAQRFEQLDEAHGDARGDRIRRCHCHDPSWQNWPALEHAVIGNIVPDFPLINKSFNLSYSGHDL